MAKRYFGNVQTAEMLQKHGQCVNNDENEVVTNIHQSQAWYEWYNPAGLFMGDTQSVSFALCTDGLNPLHMRRQSIVCGQSF